MPTIGRGGAGNIQSIVESTARTSADLEANRSAADSDPDPSTLIAARAEQPYAHTGRGGSGNYYSPRELRETGHFHGAASSHVLGDGTPAPTPGAIAAAPGERDAVRTYGRGGAGNFAFGVTESEERATRRREEEEAAKRARVAEEVAKGVRESLAMPAKAKLAGAEPY